MVAFVIELLATITEVVSLMTRTLALVVSNYRTSNTDHGSSDSNDRTPGISRWSDDSDHWTLAQVARATTPTIELLTRIARVATLATELPTPAAQPT